MWRGSLGRLESRSQKSHLTSGGEIEMSQDNDYSDTAKSDTAKSGSKMTDDRWLSIWMSLIWNILLLIFKTLVMIKIFALKMQKGTHLLANMNVAAVVS